MIIQYFLPFITSQTHHSGEGRREGVYLLFPQTVEAVLSSEMEALDPLPFGQNRRAGACLHSPCQGPLFPHICISTHAARKSTRF